MGLTALFLTDFLADTGTGLGAAGVTGFASEARRVVTMERRLLAMVGALGAGALAGVGDFFLADLAADFLGLAFFTLLGVCVLFVSVWG